MNDSTKPLLQQMRAQREQLVSSVTVPGQQNPVPLTAREHATLAAALRYWQKDGDDTKFDSEYVWMYGIATGDGAHPPLTDDEIEALCAKLKVPTAPAEQSADLFAGE